MTRIAHVSDSHDRPSIVRAACQSDADIVLITGDCLANRCDRINHPSVIPADEVRYQERWFRKHAKKWAADLGDKPVVIVRGNHDFIDYGTWLRYYGATVYEITDDNPCVEVMGLRIAGFRQVPYLFGEWAGEEHDLHAVVERAMACDPHLLATHAPMQGILDRDPTQSGAYGVRELYASLFYGEHQVTDHFFGHAHGNGGQTVEEGGIRFHNGAGTFRIVEVG